jgi:DNA-binding MarR family transcriptional regulator
MENRGLVRRIRSKEDRRKLHVHLTAKAKELKSELLPLARDVVGKATSNFTPSDTRRLLSLLGAIQMNLSTELQGEVGADE